MALDPQSNQLQDNLLSRGSRTLEKIVGCAAILAAAAFVAFDLFILIEVLRFSGRFWVLLAILAVSLGPTYFFSVIGYRLLRNRPNSAGRLAGPTVWFTCFGFFVLLALGFTAGAIAQRSFESAQGAALAGLFALLSFGAASSSRRRRPRAA